MIHQFLSDKNHLQDIPINRQLKGMLHGIQKFKLKNTFFAAINQFVNLLISSFAYQPPGIDEQISTICYFPVFNNTKSNCHHYNITQDQPLNDL